MKKSTLLLTKTIIGLTFCLSLFACKKENTTAAKKNTTTATSFTFKLDGGAAQIVDSANAVLYSNGNKRQMDIFAYKGGAEILEFHFDPKTGSKIAGTTLGTGAFLTYMASPVSSFDSQSGTLNVTTCDTIGKKIEGDFSFVAKQYPYTGSTSKSITEGHMIVTRLTAQ